MESILAGRPVVTSIHSNALDVLQEAAIAVPSGDVGAYARALLQLSDDREVYERACQSCRAVQKQFYDSSNSWAAALRSFLKTQGY